MTFWQKVRLYFGAQALMKRLGIPRKERKVIMGKLLQGIQWGNVILLVANGMNAASGAFPALAVNPWFMFFQAGLAALLPSLRLPVVGSVSHQLAGTTVVPKENA